MSVYDIVTNQIIDALKQGDIPWKKPWTNVQYESPKNFSTKREYTGLNVFTLSYYAQKKGYKTNYWLTFKQAGPLGGKVKRGEHGYPVVFWKWLDVPNDSTNGGDDTKAIPFLRYYKVFNLDQIDGIDVPVATQKEFQPIEEAERIVREARKPNIRHGGNEAYYVPRLDYIQLPEKSQFTTSEEYYATLFHELTHSTGHESRLNRSSVNDNASFGSEVYSKEELVAELGASFLCAEAGIVDRTLKNSGAYVRGWLQRLQNDKTLIVFAAAQAQKAANFILNKGK